MSCIQQIKACFGESTRVRGPVPALPHSQTWSPLDTLQRRMAPVPSPSYACCLCLCPNFSIHPGLVQCIWLQLPFVRDHQGNSIGCCCCARCRVVYGVAPHEDRPGHCQECSWVDVQMRLTSTSRICTRTALALRSSSATAAALTCVDCTSRCLVFANASIIRRFSFSAGVKSRTSAAETVVVALFSFAATGAGAGHGRSGEPFSLLSDEYMPRRSGKNSEIKRQHATRGKRSSAGMLGRECILTCWNTGQ